jgi:hypothetical protein
MKLKSLAPDTRQSEQKRSLLFGLIVTAAAVIFLLLWRFPDFPAHGGSRIIEPYGDGFKAYATYLYHIQHDSTHTWFQGMNYPFGDHAIPSDTQPLLSNSIRILSSWLPNAQNHATGLFNYSMLLGILIAGIFLYLILVKLGLPIVYAIPIAVMLPFFSPQFWRMTAHFGLAHPEVIPVLIYLLLRFDEKIHWKFSAWIGLSIAIFSLLHFYYMAIMGMTVLAYFGFRTIICRQWKQVPRFALHLSIQLALPAAILWGWMAEGPSDRTAQPAGFFTYHAIWESLLTGLHQPHWQWVDKHLIKIETTDYEGLSYVGLVAGAAIMVMIFRLLRGRFRFPLFEISGPHIGFLKILFGVSIAMALFSFGYPFTIPGFESLLSYAGPIRQFRSVGRFAWVFFYVGNIIAFLWLFSATNGKRSQPFAMIGALAILAFETWHFNRVPDLRLDEIESFIPGKRFTDIPDLDYGRYQAIMTVPYFNIGSDNLGAFGNDGFILQNALALSLQTGLPTTSAMLTRTSISQTFKQFQLISEPYRAPILLKDLEDERPFLLAVNSRKLKEDPQVSRLYRHLLFGAIPIYESGDLQLFEVPLEVFGIRIQQRRDQLSAEADNPGLFSTPPFKVDNPNFTHVYEPFDGKASERVYLGKGAWSGAAMQKHVLFDGSIPAQWPGGAYHFSMWVYVGDDLAARTQLDFEEYNPTTGERLQQKTTWLFFLVSMVDANGWALIEMPLMTSSADSKLRFSIQNKAMRGRQIYADELLIRAEAAKTYRKDSTGLWFNNRWFPFDK